MNQDKSKNKKERKMNQDKNERNMNQEKNERNMNQDKDERNMNQDKNERNLNQEKDERNLNQEKNKNERNIIHQDKNEKIIHQSQDKNNKKNERSIFHDHNKKNDPKSHQGQEKEIITEIDEVPQTKERKVPKDLTVLGNAGLPRATIAASKEVPEGTSGSSTKKTVLQQHIGFWDTNQDGVITPLDTWKGFRKLGFSLAFSAIAVSVIHCGFSYPTQKSWIPFLGNPLFNVYVDTINKAKHGSDSEVFDTEGRFVPEKFEEIFSKYDHDNKDGLNLKDIIHVIRGNANAMDPFGWIAAMFEWGTLYFLCAKDGMVSKEDIRTCYDGSLFFKMQEKEEKRQKGVPIIKSTAPANISAKEE